MYTYYVSVFIFFLSMLYFQENGRLLMGVRKYTEARKKSNQKWDKENLDRFSIVAPKGKKDKWKSAAAEAGKSLNQFVIDSVDDAIKLNRKRAGE